MSKTTETIKNLTMNKDEKNHQIWHPPSSTLSLEITSQSNKTTKNKDNNIFGNKKFQF